VIYISIVTAEAVKFLRLFMLAVIHASEVVGIQVVIMARCVRCVLDDH